MKNARLVAQAKPGVHQVKIFNCYIKKSGYVKATDKYSVHKFMYARVRRDTIEHPSTFKHFMSAVFSIARNILKKNSQQNNQL